MKVLLGENRILKHLYYAEDHVIKHKVILFVR